MEKEFEKLFRWHRGSYVESMETMQEVKGPDDVRAIIRKVFPEQFMSNIHISADSKREHRQPDDIWGRYTYMVLADFDGYTNQCIGYTNFCQEQLEEESEDEKIRKSLIRFFSAEHVVDDLDGIPFKEVVAWLESLGKQNTVEYSLEQSASIFLDALSKTPYNNKPITDAQVITKELLKFLKDTSTYNPDALLEQKPEWSEEDEDYYDAIIAKLEVTQDDALLTDNQMRFLKFLRQKLSNVERNGKNWRPSEEQMRVLALSFGGVYKEEDIQILRGLFEQLKAL